jgi:putative hydrolase of the HAD superfamily
MAIINVKAVIFDLDDTLFDRNAAQIQVVKLIVDRFPQTFQGLEQERIVEAFLESDRLSTIDFEASEPSEGLRDKRTKSFLQLLGVDEENADAITEMYVSDYPKINIPISGAVNAVKELSNKFLLAVITNGLPDVQYRKIEAIGLKDIFSAIVLSEELGIRKPDPEIFLYAAHALRVQPAECLFVGDSYRNDIIGAKTSGMKACWYNCKSSGTDISSGISADFEIHDFRELLRLL